MKNNGESNRDTVNLLTRVTRRATGDGQKGASYARFSYSIYYVVANIT